MLESYPGETDPSRSAAGVDVRTHPSTRIRSTLDCMHLPNHLELTPAFARYCPVGRSTLVEIVERIASVISHCRESGIERLLIDVTGIEGVTVPSLVDRFLMVEEWAQASEGKVAVAIVVQPEYMHPTKFGVQLAEDMGMRFDAHHTEAQAVHWLAQLPAR